MHLLGRPPVAALLQLDPKNASYGVRVTLDKAILVGLVGSTPVALPGAGDEGLS